MFWWENSGHWWRRGGRGGGKNFGHFGRDLFASSLSFFGGGGVRGNLVGKILTNCAKGFLFFWRGRRAEQYLYKEQLLQKQTKGWRSKGPFSSCRHVHNQKKKCNTIKNSVITMPPSPPPRHPAHFKNVLFLRARYQVLCRGRWQERTLFQDPRRDKAQSFFDVLHSLSNSIRGAQKVTDLVLTCGMQEEEQQQDLTHTLTWQLPTHHCIRAARVVRSACCKKMRQRILFETWRPSGQILLRLKTDRQGKISFLSCWPRRTIVVVGGGGRKGDNQTLPSVHEDKTLVGGAFLF